MNEIQVTVRGNVTSEPRHIRFDDGNTVTSFRVASNTRRFDNQIREWVDTGTIFMNVNCRRGLASNVAKSLSKGQPILVVGRLRERSWEKNGRSGRSLEIEAEGLGHDLSWGTTSFSRVVRTEQLTRSAKAQGDTMAYVVSIDNGDAPDGAQLADADFDDDPGDLDADVLGADDLDAAEHREERLPAAV